MKSLKKQQLVDKIIGWTEAANEWKFRPYQRKSAKQVVESILIDAPGILTRLWSRKSGKTDTLKMVMSALMAILPGLARSHFAKDFPRLKLFRSGFQVAFAAPKEQLAQLPFKRLRKQARQKHFLKHLNSLDVYVQASNSSTFELSNESIATAFSGSETASNEGEGAHCLILDESQKLSPFSVYKILRPMVAHCDGLIIEIGTAFRKKGPFKGDIEYNKRKFPDLHQEVPYTDVTPFSHWYASYIDKEIDRLPGGKDNPAFKMNYLLEWLIAEGHFVDPDIFIELNTAHRGPSGGKLTAGVDWGKVESSTAVTILESQNGNTAVVDLFEIKGDWDHQCDYLIPFLKDLPLTKVFSEATGAGDPLTTRLAKELGKNKVEGKFMSAPYKDQIFTTLQTEITAKLNIRRIMMYLNFKCAFIDFILI